MPSIVQTGPYPLASEITARARAYTGDIQDDDLAGDLLADDRPATLLLLNSSIDYLFRKLTRGKVNSSTEENYILNVPASTVVDRNNQMRISYNGTLDVVAGVSYATPFLPPDLLEPLLVFHRGVNENRPFAQMVDQADGKPSASGAISPFSWDWRSDCLWVPASVRATDLKLRYLATNVPRVVDISSDRVQILGSTEALALLLASRHANTRGGLGPASAAAFKTQADDEIADMIDRENDRRQRRPVRKRGYNASRGIRRPRWMFIAQDDCHCAPPAPTPVPPPSLTGTLYTIIPSIG